MIGENLKYYRTIQGLTQRDLSYTTGLSPGYIGTIESRNNEIYLSSAIKIANALEINVEDLCREITREEWEQAKEIRSRRMEAREQLKKKRKRKYKIRWIERKKNEI